jgi:hypothetical protein
MNEDLSELRLHGVWVAAFAGTTSGFVTAVR